MNTNQTYRQTHKQVIKQTNKQKIKQTHKEKIYVFSMNTNQIKKNVR